MCKNTKNYCTSKNTNGADTFQMIKQYQNLEEINFRILADKSRKHFKFTQNN